MINYMRNFEDFSEQARERAWKHILSYPDAQEFIDFITKQTAEYLLRESNLLNGFRSMNLTRMNKNNLEQKVSYDFSFSFHSPYEIQSLFNMIVKTVDENPDIFPPCHLISHILASTDRGEVFVEVNSRFNDEDLEDSLCFLLENFFISHKKAMQETLEDVIHVALNAEQFNFFVTMFDLNFDEFGELITHRD